MDELERRHRLVPRDQLQPAGDSAPGLKHPPMAELAVDLAPGRAALESNPASGESTNVAICGFFVVIAFDFCAPIFRLALMGADEEAETKSKTVEAVDFVFGPSVLEKLDAGWRIAERGSDGQLLLLPPAGVASPADPDSAA